MPRGRIPARIWSRPAHWRLLAFCLLVMLVVIGFQGFATHTIGGTSETDFQSAAAPIANQGPILVARHGRLTSLQAPPGRRVALTFDDGPDPRWTLPIAAELRAAEVHATFFEIGSQAARYPSIVRRLVGDGNEIGNDTFTHVLLSAIPAWQRQAQLELTEAAIAGITGHYTRLMRPPYSSRPDAVTNVEDRDLAQLAGNRYFVVLTTTTARTGSAQGLRISSSTRARRKPAVGSSCSTTAVETARRLWPRCDG